MQDLQVGEVVLVNQMKKRRVRIIRLTEGGQYKVLGWVSTHTDSGQQLLVSCDDELLSSAVE